MSSIALLFLAASSALATPITSAVDTSILPANYARTATNWNAQGVRGGVSYDFNVTGAREDSFHLPAFTAYCTGYDTGAFSDCELVAGETLSGTTGVPSVAARLVPSNGNGTAIVGVSLFFTDEQAQVSYNITGTGYSIVNAFLAPPQTFTVTPTEVTAVA